MSGVGGDVGLVAAVEDFFAAMDAMKRRKAMAEMLSVERTGIMPAPGLL
jgi:hypothetical protein